MAGPPGVGPNYGKNTPSKIAIKKNTVAPAAAKFANKAVKNVMTNKLVPSKTPAARGGASSTIIPKARAKGAPTPTNGYGNKVTNQTATPTPTPTGDDSLTTDYGDLGNLMDSQQIAGLAGKIQLPNASKYANAMSNLQYGGKITALTQRIKGLTDALPGSLQALDKAFANIDAQRPVSVNNFQTSGQGVANLFGGNTSAAGVAANQSAQASATAANQAGSLTDQNQANATREADWKERVNLLNNLQVNQAQSDLIGAQGDRDNAKKGYYDQALKTRQDMVSQAISNQGALNNQDITRKLAQSQLDQAGVKTTSGKIANAAASINLAALPRILQNQINSGKEGILTSQLTRQITAKTATAQLAQIKKQNAGVSNVREAVAAGGQAALAAMILPNGAVTQDPTTGKVTLQGDPNVYYRNGVAAIMQQFPKMSKAKAKLFVSNQVSQAVAEAGWGNFKNGRWIKVGK